MIVADASARPIVVDTSALMAILLGEAQAEDCMAAIETADRLVISAGTVAEALVVAGRRGLGAEMTALINGLGFEILPLDAAAARRIAAIYDRWGKGVHPAALNLGDCFACEVALAQDGRLLFVGNDFARTEVRSAV